SLRRLAGAAPQRLAYLPGVPSAAGSGLPRWRGGSWQAPFPARGAPKPIAYGRNAPVRAMAVDPANRQKFDESFYEPLPLSAEGLAARVGSDVAKWERIVNDAGIEPQ